VRRCAILVAVVALALTGCGGASGTDPNAYVRSVCTSLTSWRDSVQAAGSVLQSAASAGHVSLQQGKQSYLRFVAALLRATTAAETSLKEAGVPAVTGGKGVSTALVNAFGGAQKALATAASQASLIPITNTAAYGTAAGAVTSAIRSALASMTAVSPRQNAQLRAAADKQPECSALKAAGG
jgi:hypothetical protein